MAAEPRNVDVHAAALAVCGIAVASRPSPGAQRRSAVTRSAARA